MVVTSQKLATLADALRGVLLVLRKTRSVHCVSSIWTRSLNGGKLTPQQPPALATSSDV
jgi:hypothetical protein